MSHGSWICTLLVTAAVSCPTQECDSTGCVDALPTTAESWLDKIAQRFDQVKSLRAEVSYERTDGLGILDAREKRQGSFVFETGPPARFSVHFDKLTVDGRPARTNMWYIFDGRWIVERNEQEKIFIKRQIVPPDAPAATDPLATGNGPFFLPITAKKSQILRRFEPTIVTPNDRDPPNTVHLQLIPKPGRRMEIARVDLWYDRTTLVPIRVETLDDVPNQQIVTVKNISFDEPIKPKRLDVSRPRGKGWRVTVEPYRKVTKDEKSTVQRENR